MVELNLKRKVPSAKRGVNFILLEVEKRKNCIPAPL
jgi:hypothetical protein